MSIREGFIYNDPPTIDFTLDDYVPYYHGSEKFARSINGNGFDKLKVGDYLKINLDRISSISSVTIHYGHDDLLKIVEKSSISNSTDVISSGSSNSIIISPNAVDVMNSPAAMNIARQMSKMVDETGKEFEFKIEETTINGKKLTYSLICRNN